jgi:hypothetical protein
LAPSFSSVSVRGLFAPPPIAEVELARSAAARERARHPHAWPVRMVLRLMPDPVRGSLRRLARRVGPGDPAAIRGYSVEDLWYADGDLDAAVDLQAICVTDAG